MHGAALTPGLLSSAVRTPAPFATTTPRSRLYTRQLTTCYGERQETPRWQREDTRGPSRQETRDARGPRSGERDGGGGRGRGGGRGGGGGGRGGGGGGGWGQSRPGQQQKAVEFGQLDIPIVRPGQANSTTFFSAKKFGDLGASEEVVAALQALGITRPSHIQAAAYTALMSNSKHVVLADHAGSGKTLAYLLPLLQVLKEEEKLMGRAATQPNCPRLVVVVPTAELCTQVVRVCRAISKAGLRFRSAAMTGGHPMRTQKEALEGGVDVVVGTPGRLAELAAEGDLRLDFCRAVVVDEVDVLLGEDHSFADQVRPLQAAAPDTTRFVFATATIPEQVYLDLEEEFPGLVAALGPGLHRTAPGITEQLVDCSGGNEVSEETGFLRKAAALFAVLQEQRAQRAIVFCNKIETCRKVENFLNRSHSREDNVDVLPHHAAIADDRRNANLRRFLIPPGGVSSGSGRRSGGGSKSASTSGDGQRLVLVCTDRASRGMDSAFVEHVVLFDMPRDPSEYLRRVGRTTRGAGSTGTVSVLALGRQVKLAKEIIDRNQGGLALHRIPAALPVVSGGLSSDADRLRSDMATDRLRSDMAAAAATAAVAPAAAAEPVAAAAGAAAAEPATSAVAAAAEPEASAEAPAAEPEPMVEAAAEPAVVVASQAAEPTVAVAAAMAAEQPEQKVKQAVEQEDDSWMDGL